MSKQQEQRDALWVSLYKKLKEFKAAHGHTKVPSTWHDNTLAKWVSRQREKEDSMDARRKKQLNAIGFSWHKQMQKEKDQLWQTKYDELKSFYKKHKHFRIPSLEEDYRSLRIWVDAQRANETTMPANRKKLLDSIKFRWNDTIKAEEEAGWEAMYKELVGYHKKHGDCMVSSHSLEHPQLGGWVSRQRRRWESLDKAKRKKLAALGFATSSHVEKERRKKWLSMLALVKQFKKEVGNCRVPNKYEENPSLGRWVEVQRLEEKNMPSWKKKELNAIGFEWSGDLKASKEKRWFTMYAKLEKFYKRFKHSSVPEYWQGDPKLAIWVSYQRRAKKPLSNKKIELLNKIEFDWWPM